MFFNAEIKRHMVGVLMATDIAFGVGNISINWFKSTVGLKIVLAALAIIDDLMAIIKDCAILYGSYFYDVFDVSFSYSSDFSHYELEESYEYPLYLVLGVVLWFFMFNLSSCYLAAVI